MGRNLLYLQEIKLICICRNRTICITFHQKHLHHRQPSTSNSYPYKLAKEVKGMDFYRLRKPKSVFYLTPSILKGHPETFLLSWFTIQSILTYQTHHFDNTSFYMQKWSVEQCWLSGLPKHFFFQRFIYLLSRRGRG